MKTRSTHGGNVWQLARKLGLPPREILDFSANINPLGPPDSLRNIIRGQAENLVHYPDPDCSELTGAIAEYLKVNPQQVVCGNGSSELIYALPRVLKTNRAVLPAPCYVDYARAAQAAGLETVHVLPETLDLLKNVADYRVAYRRDNCQGRARASRPAAARPEAVALPKISCSLPRGASIEISFKRLEAELRGSELVFIGQPNNPTGLLCDNEAFFNLTKTRKNTLFVVDEAFADFVEGYRSVIHHKLPNVIVLRSMTKFFAVPGLRLGFLLGPAKIIESVRRTLPFWSVNHLAQAAGIAFLADKDYMTRTRRFVQERRAELYRQLSSFPGFFVYPGQANYLLVRMDCAEWDAEKLHARLLRKGIVIRVCDNFAGLDKRFFRVAVRTEKEDRRLCDTIAEIFGRNMTRQQNTSNRETLNIQHSTSNIQRKCLISNRPTQQSLKVQRWKLKVDFSQHVPSRPPALMLQGTCSGAGKSILAAAFCRILLQDGFHVAPFKAQNMSLNSFVTPDGGEIGRAQALQAQACRLEPDVRMNPLLLKPSSDTGTQVIVLGRSAGNMNVDQYIRFKPRVVEKVKQAYDRLAAEHEVIVLEGAGSPAEVNLKAHDIVNMRMAEYAEAKVLIAGDIDRGGVFASFAGTYDLFDNWERGLTAGFIVNRFRGDAGLLTEALDFIERYTNRPVLGVVPYLADLQLPEEDSVTFKSRAYEAAGLEALVLPLGIETGRATASMAYSAKVSPLATKAGPCRPDRITIAVIDLPHISNFTDFDALRLEPDVAVRIVRRSEDLKETDVIILPGSKNVPGDLAYLRKAGFEQKIIEAAKNGRTEIIGICAGLQMLGQNIRDPHHIESERENTPGLGILPLTTTLSETKTLTRVSGVHAPSGLAVRGYEIHHGQSRADGLVPIVRRNDGKAIGFGTKAEKIWGTYLHGIFDADEFRRWFVDRLRAQKGLAPMGRVLARYDLEPALDRLADVVRKSVRMDKIYKMLGLNPDISRQKREISAFGFDAPR